MATEGDQIKLSATLPKGMLNGFDEELAEELADLREARQRITPRAAVFLYDVQDIVLNADGSRTVRLRIRRAQPITLHDGRKAVAQALHDEIAARTGGDVPVELADLSKHAFADVAESVEERDQREEAEREGMHPFDEMRRHLERVHGVENADTMTEFEAETRHKSDHEPGVLPEGLQHDEDERFWTWADIEARTEDDASDDNAGAVHSGWMPADIADDESRAAGGDDSDYGRDLDDETGASESDDTSNVVAVEFSGRGE